MVYKRNYLDALAEHMMWERMNDWYEDQPTKEQIELMKSYVKRVSIALGEFAKKYPQEFTFEWLERMAYGTLHTEPKPSQEEVYLYNILNQWYGESYPDC